MLSVADCKARSTANGPPWSQSNHSTAALAMTIIANTYSIISHIKKFLIKVGNKVVKTIANAILL